MMIALFATAQVRTSLFEEFTGENCGPCAATNPALDALLASGTNPSKIIPLKWEVDIPSAPSATWSLWQTNKAEIGWRAYNYGYGINSAPQGKIDGQNLTVFGSPNNQPGNLNNTIINTAQTKTTNFSINMSTAWNPTFSNCVVSVTVTSSTAFTSVGALMFRLCLVERSIKFATPSGSNGEKDFYDAVRKSYPTTIVGNAVTAMGTAINNVWTAGQSQTFTVNCNIPSYINDVSQMAFVGFVQSDGNRLVYQAARTAQPAIPNEAKAISANITAVVCTATTMPTVDINNNGANTITDMTITPYVDGVIGTDVIWNGNLPSGNTVNIPMDVITTAAGPHTYSYNITGVSGGDIVLNNNSKSTVFLSSFSSFPGPVNEGFVGAAFPPLNWTVINPDGNPNTFVKSSLAGGFGLSSQSVLYQVNSAPQGDEDQLYLPPTDLSTVSNPYFSFDLAYRQVNAGNTDKDSIKVYISNNCGSSWSLIYANGGTNMATALPPSTTWFVPTSTQWKNISIPLPSYANVPQAIVRIIGKGNKGNRIFLDNINLAPAVLSNANFSLPAATCGAPINAANTSTGTPANSYTWTSNPAATISNPSAINPSLTFTASGTYTVTLAANNGFNTSTTSKTIAINSIPANAVFSMTSTACDNVAVNVNNTSTGGCPVNTYTWSSNPPATISNPSASNPSVTFTTSGNYVISLSANNGGATSTSTQAIVVSICGGVGLTENSSLNENISLYPNPASDKINIELANASAFNYQITDVLGKTIVNHMNNKTSATVDVSTLAKGIYILTIESNGQKASRKIKIE